MKEAENNQRQQQQVALGKVAQQVEKVIVSFVIMRQI